MEEDRLSGLASGLLRLMGAGRLTGGVDKLVGLEAELVRELVPLGNVIVTGTCGDF